MASKTVRPCKPSPGRILHWLREIKAAAPAVLFPLLPHRWAGQCYPTGRQPAGGISQGNASASRIPSVSQSTTVQWHSTESSLDFSFFPPISARIMNSQHFFFLSMLPAGISALPWHQERAVSHMLTHTCPYLLLLRVGQDGLCCAWYFLFYPG